MSVLDIKTIEEDLNRRYLQNQKEYTERVETLKGVGYKIFRNSKGQHRVEYNNDYFNEIFGGHSEIFSINKENVYGQK